MSMEFSSTVESAILIGSPLQLVECETRGKSKIMQLVTSALRAELSTQEASSDTTWLPPWQAEQVSVAA